MMSEEASQVQKRLECSICLNNFNPDDNLPRALRCQHTFCASCVGSLTKIGVISCPKCRTITKQEEVITNFALMEVIETLCEECQIQDKKTRCDHCNQSYCETCYEKHFVLIKTDAAQGIKALSEKLLHLTSITTDTNVLKMEEEKAEEAKQKLKEDLNGKRQALDQYELNMFSKFDDIMDENIHAHTVWREEVDIKVAKIKSFIQTAERKLIRKNVERNDLVQLQKDGVRYLTSLEESDSKRPELVPFPAEIPPDVVEIPKLPVSGTTQFPHKVVTKFASGMTDHTSVKLKQIAGSKGSDYQDFLYPGAIAVIPPHDRLAVVDFQNNRVKVYDKDLNLLLIFGTAGSSVAEFDEIIGINVSQDNELFISDGKNHRIQAFSQYGQYLQSFGTQGSAPRQFFCPAGMAFNKNGLMFVCDEHNYRIQVFMPEGKFVRMFGLRGTSPDQFENVPVGIAFSKGGLILVVEGGKRVKVFEQDGRYIKTIPNNMPVSFGTLKANGVAVDKYGNIVIADVTGRLVVLKENGDFVCTIGCQGTEPGKFKGPDGVAVTSTGDIVVCDSRNHRVQLLTVCRRWDHIE